MIYHVTSYSGLYLLTIGDASQLFASRSDAEREGQRLVAAYAHPPLAWTPSSLPAGVYPIPHDAPPAVCASCGAAIVWTRTATGAAIPLSLATGREERGRRVASTHFFDCPNSVEWSR